LGPELRGTVVTIPKVATGLGDGVHVVVLVAVEDDVAETIGEGRAVLVKVGVTVAVGRPRVGPCMTTGKAITTARGVSVGVLVTTASEWAGGSGKSAGGDTATAMTTDSRQAAIVAGRYRLTSPPLDKP
jgi:hypothetical protein